MKFGKLLLTGLYINIILVILLIVLLFISAAHPNINGWILLIVLCAAFISSFINIVLGILNIYSTYRLYKNNEYNSLRKYMKVLKFGSVPYFIINFIFYFFVFAILVGASRGIFLLPVMILSTLMIFFTYLAAIFTSSYGIGFLAIIYKEKKINKRSFIIHILLQICFVLDVFDTIILLKKYKRKL